MIELSLFLIANIAVMVYSECVWWCGAISSNYFFFYIPLVQIYLKIIDQIILQMAVSSQQLLFQKAYNKCVA